jgi:hypothetical protein
MPKPYTECEPGATVAALYVRSDGPYVGRPDVDAWTEERDARTYPGPLPVVAHPPCARWGNLWWSARHKGLGLGDDDGCFAAAVASVRRWGGVLEHPSSSRAWARFGLVPPPSAGWARNPFAPREWTANVHQRNYGHRALKRTWLLYVGDRTPPPLDWGDPESPEAWVTWGATGAETRARGVEVMCKRERELTPAPFVELLLGLARGCRE